MSIKSDLLCGICKKIFKDPIFLPCHCTICKEHVQELTNQTNEKTKVFKCEQCNEEFEPPSNGFKENTRLKLIIEKNAHLSDEEKDLKNDIESNYAEYERILKELQLKEVEFESITFDHFAEIKRNIDLRRETLKLRIDKIADEMIEKAKKLEENYKKNFELTNKLNHSQEDFHQETQKLIEMFRDPIGLKSAIALKLDHDGKLAELQAKLNRYNWLQHDLKAYDFEKNFEFQNDDFFGYLKYDETKSSGINQPIQFEENFIRPFYARNVGNIGNGYNFSNIHIRSKYQ